MKESEEREIEENAKKLIYLIAAGCIILITGNKKKREEIIRKALSRTKTSLKTIYIDAEKKYKWELGKILVESNGMLLGKILGLMPKGRVLFVEDAEFLTERNMKMIRYFYDENNLKSVVISCKDKSIIKRLPDALKSRIGNRIIDLQK